MRRKRLRLDFRKFCIHRMHKSVHIYASKNVYAIQQQPTFKIKNGYMKRLKSTKLHLRSSFKGLLMVLLFWVQGVSTLQAQDQGVRVTGYVTGENGEALTGVAVQVKGSATRGTVTGNDGRFSLTVPDERAVLVFTSVGYQPREVAVAGNLDMTVGMQASAGSMAEVVVVGYGTQQKKTLTGAVATIKASEINTTKRSPGSIAGSRRPSPDNSIHWSASGALVHRCWSSTVFRGITCLISSASTLRTSNPYPF
jgi:hypothetical protein